MPVLFGLWFIAVGFGGLWYRDEIYSLLQWGRQYSDHSFAYVLINIVCPVLAIVVGIALIELKFVSQAIQ